LTRIKRVPGRAGTLDFERSFVPCAACGVAPSDLHCGRCCRDESAGRMSPY